MVTYTSACPVERADTGVLAVHCSDHRFARGLRDFLDQGLNLKANYDALIVPGGPQCLRPLPHLPKFSWASRKWFKFLVEVHSLRRIILIAHQDCGWYKWLASYEPGAPDVRERQEEDERSIREVFIKDFPELTVELYYAGWDANDRVVVETVRSQERQQSSLSSHRRSALSSHLRM